MKGLLRMNPDRYTFILVILIVLGLSSCKISHAQDDEEGYSDNPAALQVAAQLLYEQIANATLVFEDDIQKYLGFCIKDVKDEWNKAFNFSRDLGFMTSCMKSKKDVPKRICTAAEVKIYFNSFLDESRESSNYLEPNRNCNLSSWIEGCEPGWSCSVGKDQKVDMKNVKDVPLRTKVCQPCCEGFFCPKGITCMLPCPLGAYCPAAKLNKTSGTCEPYAYQIPPGKKNHTCGGADLWADAINSSEVFCQAGSYCPSTTQILPCNKGYYCRLGSTAPKECFQLATCNPKSTNQNIHAYGVILIAILSTSLLLVYTFSDQILTTREKRVAESRERAIKSARETAQARERWKSAKDNAMKRAIGLQQSLSRTFSKRKSVKPEQQSKGFGKQGIASDGAESSTTSTASSSKEKKKEPTNLTKMMQQIEEDPDSHQGFNVESGGEKKKFNAKELHTRSQIFKYAYGQIEKEKAIQEQNKNLTFSGVISMAATNEHIEIRKRPLLEIDFKDLTLTLKGKNKHLLRCITGKLKPGRVSAVMGPSGAGKTTFLSAVTGKATGCNVTGSILINGKEESIHSYKRIFGFVPQDDIVHGDLTVEENLRFSARCRLPADLPKPDKVLIIERVIEALGLQAIRDSLVGTVEKRGISGGQRKRVNVGLEMVIEPSLLVLDEPTSGLDSSSSLLLLRAIRREALEGVNICMVIHQPSYALFKMFDDFILLAKGGLTVYHGSVKKVEEYFSGLGINVPERVTPPDHYIDILEGITKPGSNITREQLPVRWMLHNGYAVPPDMLHLCEEATTSSSEDSTKRGSSFRLPERSFFGDLLQELKFKVILRAEHLMHNFLRKQDLSNRVTPGVLRQYRYFLGRVTKQRLRESKLQAVDYLILLLAGACLGTLAKVSDETFGALGYNYTVIAVSLLCMIAALRSFTLDRLQYWRESSSGMSSMAYFLSKDTIDHFNTIVKPLVYLSMFYFFNNPRSSFGANYLVLFCLVYCVTGIAYALAIFLEPGPAQLWCVLLPVVLSLVASQDKDSKIMYEIGKFTYSKWALEAFVIANAEQYYGAWLITRCGSLLKNNYSVHDWTRCLIYLIVAGVISRIIAFIFMLMFQKK